jgi:hypothetical protein
MTTKTKIFKYSSNINEKQIETYVNQFIGNKDVVSNVSIAIRTNGDIFIVVTYRE